MKHHSIELHYTAAKARKKFKDYFHINSMTLSKALVHNLLWFVAPCSATKIFCLHIKSIEDQKKRSSPQFEAIFFPNLIGDQKKGNSPQFGTVFGRNLGLIVLTATFSSNCPDSYS